MKFKLRSLFRLINILLHKLIGKATYFIAYSGIAVFTVYSFFPHDLQIHMYTIFLKLSKYFNPQNPANYPA